MKRKEKPASVRQLADYGEAMEEKMKHKFLTWLCHFVNDFLAKRMPNAKYRCPYASRHQYDDTD